MQVAERNPENEGKEPDENGCEESLLGSQSVLVNYATQPARYP
jgi:hypothetical protein